MIVIYTALFGNYDKLPKIKKYEGIARYICFTDVIPKEKNGWEFELVEMKYSPTKTNRWYKFHPHLLFPDYDFSIYVDANIKVIGNPRDLIESYKDALISVPRHKYRNCLYKEIDECLTLGKINITEANYIKDKYKKKGFPEEFGLGEMSFIVRSHNDRRVIKLMDEWWNEFSLFDKRDQLSFMYVIWKNNLKIVLMKENMQNINPYFYRLPHSGEKNKFQAKLRNFLCSLLSKVNQIL